mgnify:CR=1 FL=1
MEIKMTEKQFRRLLDLVYIGNWILNSTRGDDRIRQYDEVESMYLMSGAFDLTVIISGRTLREVALFVSERLSTIQGVTGTATHFILKKYKEKHLVFRPQDPEEREYIFV